MKASELNAKSVEELKALEGDLRKQLFQNRFANYTNRLDSTAKIPATRRDIARVLTALRQKEILAATKSEGK